MADTRRLVFGERGTNDRLPEWANNGVFIIEWLRQQGLWSEATERLKIQREGGYAGIDALVFLAYFFGSGLPIGIKELSDRAREYHKQLAAVGERRWLPTQSSMSRILAAVEAEPANEFGSWLLLQAPDIVSVLQHPSVLTRDAIGAGWHVFDWDPTVTTLRHRALPIFEGMPDGRRRSESLAAPGYPGRKRGDVQFSRATLQHAGSGLWLDIEMAPGNGALREAVQSAIRQVEATCNLADISPERAVLRMDGASGNVPALTACMNAGIRYVTRLAHYQLLEDKDIVRHLNETQWFEVPSSGSGPTRQAADLGRVVLEPAPTTLQTDGSVFAPIETRVVVSRFPCSTDGRGAGVTLDGWHYELYGTDLDSTAWPEAEVVAGYYGRTGQENRFYQEDRELGLDRIFSYNLPGQQLATAIGLFVWNFQICRGMDLARPPETLPEQPLAENEPLAETPRLPEEAVMAPSTSAGEVCNDIGPASPSKLSAVEGKAQPNPPTETTNDVDPTSPPQLSVVVEGKVQSNPPTETTNDVDPTSPSPLIAVKGKAQPNPSFEATNAAGHADNGSVTKEQLLAALAAVDWGHVLEKHDGWSWLTEPGGLQCPAKAVLPLIRVEQVKGIPIRARFQADWGTCDACDLRASCVRSGDPSYRKDVRLAIPPPHDQVLRRMWLHFIQGQRASCSVLPQRKKGGQVAPARTRLIWRLKPLSWRPVECLDGRSKLAVAAPILLPAELRKVTRLATRDLEAHVAAELPPPFPRPCPVLAPSIARRQKRRLTWAERLLWNQLPPGTRVHIRLLGAKSLRQLLGSTEFYAKSA